MYLKGIYPDSIEVTQSGGAKNAGKNLQHYRIVHFYELQLYFYYSFSPSLPSFEDIHTLPQGETEIRVFYYQNPPIIEHLQYVRHCVDLFA